MPEQEKSHVQDVVTEMDTWLVMIVKEQGNFQDCHVHIAEVLFGVCVTDVTEAEFMNIKEQGLSCKIVKALCPQTVTTLFSYD